MPDGTRAPKSPSHVFLILGITLICIALITGAVALFFSLSGQDNGTPTISSAPSSSPSLPASTAPSTAPSGPSISDVTDEEVQALVDKADFIAAGYDYEKAIALLKSAPYYNEKPLLAEKVAAYEQAESELVVWKDNSIIRHVFFHSLIVDTDKAFDGDFNSYSYNLYMTTVAEFNAILEQMYARGYVLISPYDMAHAVTDENGTHFEYGEIRLPEGKIPFLMSQDDVNYYGYMIGIDNDEHSIPKFVNSDCDGFAHKLVIGEDGYPTCEYMDKDGNIVTGDYDLVPLLERFIQEHPDFSYRGARAMLAVTGYEGVFGYRTKPAFEDAMGSEAYAKEVADAKALTQCLKDHGWIIASHSYGHPRYGEISAERVERDSTKWEDTVQPVVGDTDILIFPHGSDIHNWRPIPPDNEKFITLYEDGYRYFINVDSNVWNQLGTNHFRGGRLNLDGFVMYHRPYLLTEFFDVETVFDPNRPTPVPSL